MDSALDTEHQERSDLAVASLKRPQPWFLGGSADLFPVQFPLGVIGLKSLARHGVIDDEEEDTDVIIVAGLSVTVMILVVAVISCTTVSVRPLSMSCSP